MGSWIANKLIEKDKVREDYIFKKFSESAKQVTYNTFSRKLGTEILDQIRAALGYKKDKRSGVTLTADREIKFYRGYYDQKPALVIVKDEKRMVFTYEAGRFGG
jgi:hypothetical protein